MLILLPPSESKSRPESGPPLDLEKLAFPALNPTRSLLLRTLVRVSSGNPKRAAATLKLGASQVDELAVNAALAEEPAARADTVFNGVLFEHAGLSALPAHVRERADRTIAIASGLFGLVRPNDLIPAYRLAGNVTLPRLGTVSSRWKPTIANEIETAAARGLVIDLRSGTYSAFGAAPADQTATIRVLSERDGQRTVVSHFNKATKGRVVRDLMYARAEPDTVAELLDLLSDAGWQVEPDGSRLDIVVR